MNFKCSKCSAFIFREKNVSMTSYCKDGTVYCFVLTKLNKQVRNRVERKDTSGMACKKCSNRLGGFVFPTYKKKEMMWFRINRMKKVRPAVKKWRPVVEEVSTFFYIFQLFHFLINLFVFFSLFS